MRKKEEKFYAEVFKMLEKMMTKERPQKEKETEPNRELKEYDRNILSKLTDIAYRHLTYEQDYSDIVSKCSKKLMSKSRHADLYGMFYPEKSLIEYFGYKGRITKNEKNRDYVYYFDDNDRLRLTERYNSAGDQLMNLIFYYYYDNYIEIVWYRNPENVICKSGFIEYENGKMTKFVESYNIARYIKENKNIKSYNEYLFDADDEYVLHRVYDFAEYLTGEEHDTTTKWWKKR